MLRNAHHLIYHFALSIVNTVRAVQIDMKRRGRLARLYKLNYRQTYVERVLISNCVVSLFNKSDAASSR